MKNKEKLDRDDHVLRTGKVIDVLKGNFKIKMDDNGEETIARVSGKIRENKILLILGDRVEIKFSVYSPNSNGFIYKRL